MFITFEGMDGTGKTTQIERLRARLEAEGFAVVATREPGGSAVAERIRALLLDRDSDMDSLTEAYLYAAARAEHVRRVIVPALQRGAVVLCDRFLDSSLAYQGCGRGLSVEAVRQINACAVQGAAPDRTYLFVLGAQDAARRVQARGARDRIEQAGDDFHLRAAQGFLRLAREEPARILVVDAGRPVDAIAQDIARDALRLLR